MNDSQFNQLAFGAGVKEGTLNAMFEYVFDNKMNATKVKVHMTQEARLLQSRWLAASTTVRDLTGDLGKCAQHVIEQVLSARDCALQLLF
jgi:hypothetical protein